MPPLVWHFRGIGELYEDSRSLSPALAYVGQPRRAPLRPARAPRARPGEERSNEYPHGLLEGPPKWCHAISDDSTKTHADNLSAGAATSRGPLLRAAPFFWRAGESSDRVDVLQRSHNKIQFLDGAPRGSGAPRAPPAPERAVVQARGVDTVDLPSASPPRPRGSACRHLPCPPSRAEA
eukprot:scaffold605_cov400-Prasinococcus_capsulatus_cf.AAC.19